MATAEEFAAEAWSARVKAARGEAFAAIFDVRVTGGDGHGGRMTLPASRWLTGTNENSAACIVKLDALAVQVQELTALVASLRPPS